MSDHIVDACRYAVHDRIYDIVARMQHRRQTKSSTMREWLTDELVEQDLVWVISEVQRLRGEKAELMGRLRDRETELGIKTKENTNMKVLYNKHILHLRIARRHTREWRRKYLMEATKDEVCVV